MPERGGLSVAEMRVTGHDGFAVAIGRVDRCFHQVMYAADLLHQLVAYLECLTHGRLGSGHHDAAACLAPQLVDEITVRRIRVRTGLIRTDGMLPHVQHSPRHSRSIPGGENSLPDEHHRPRSGDPVHVAPLVNLVDSLQ